MINSRKDYERNLYLLREKLDQGLVQFSYEVKRSVEGILNVRQAHNGRINLNTIDEMARMTANSIVSMMSNFPKGPSGKNDDE
ncbi:MAG: hypothetical protein V4456_16615 [Bacteroidota bacterium]